DVDFSLATIGKSTTSVDERLRSELGGMAA
ncbi:unnamed protein product, partial [Rotaria sp. Silwood1]